MSSGADTASLNDAPSALWRNVSFHLLWSSTFASGVGDRMAMLAAMAMLGYAGEGAENSSISSAVDFFFFLPYLLWSPFAGWMADRLPRKWLMFAADELRGLFVLTALWFMPAVTGQAMAEHQWWMVWAMMCAIGVMAATFVPAKMSIVPNVVGPALLTRGNAAVVSMGVIGNMIGFLIGGSLTEQSIRGAIGVSAGCYMISGLFWIFLKTPWQAPRGAAAAAGMTLAGEPALHGPIHALREINDGARYAIRHRPVIVLIITSALVWTGTAIYMPSLAVINVTFFEGKIASLSLLLASVGIGMLVGSIALGLMNPRLGSELLITGGLFGCGLFIGLQMVVQSYPWGIVMALATGFSAAVLLVPLNTLIQRITPDHIRGRVFAAKEVGVEFGKVVIAGVIWRVPGTDPYMRPLCGALAMGLIVAGMFGVWRFVLRGPHRTAEQNLLWRLTRLYVFTFHRLTVVGKANVPREGPVVLVSNHTAGVDAPLIQAVVSRRVRWLMAAEYRYPMLWWFWRVTEPVMVARSGRDAAAVRQAVRLLRQGELVGIFPEGGINHDREPLKQFFGGAAMLAMHSGARIVPVYISGTPRCPRAFDSLFRLSRSRVVIGRSFTIGRTIGDRDGAAAMIRDRVMALADK